MNTQDSSDLKVSSDAAHTNPYFVPECQRASLLPPDALAKQSRWRWLYLGGAMLAPFPILGCFVVITRKWITVALIWDLPALAISAAAGVCCLWQLPISRLARVMLTLIYLSVIWTLSQQLFDFVLRFIMAQR